MKLCLHRRFTDTSVYICIYVLVVCVCLCVCVCVCARAHACVTCVFIVNNNENFINFVNVYLLSISLFIH